MRLAAQLALVAAGGAVMLFLLRRASIDSTGASRLVGVALALVGFVQNRHHARFVEAKCAPAAGKAP